MMRNESLVKIFHSHTNARINIMMSHNQTPTRIDISKSIWVMIKEAEIIYYYLCFEYEEEI